MPVEPVQPADIYQQLVADVALHGAATEQFLNNFQFYGRTLQEHSEALLIHLPDKPDSEEIRSAYIQLIRNIQIASNYLGIASSINEAIGRGNKAKRSDIVAAITASYENTNRRRPAALVIENMADSYLANTVGVNTASKILKDFWRNKLDVLIEIRKSLESYSISMHTEMKHLDKTV